MARRDRAELNFDERNCRCSSMDSSVVSSGDEFFERSLGPTPMQSTMPSRSPSEASTVLPLTSLWRTGADHELVKGALSKNTPDVSGGAQERIAALYRSLVRGDAMLKETGFGPGALDAAKASVFKAHPTRVKQNQQHSTSGGRSVARDSQHDLARLRIAHRVDQFKVDEPPKMTATVAIRPKPISREIHKRSVTASMPAAPSAQTTSIRSGASSVSNSRESVIRDAYRVGLVSTSKPANPESVAPSHRISATSSSRPLRSSTPIVKQASQTTRGIVSTRQHSVDSHNDDVDELPLASNIQVSLLERGSGSLSPTRLGKQNPRTTEAVVSEGGPRRSCVHENLASTAAWMRNQNEGEKNFVDRSELNLNQRWSWLRWTLD